MKKTRMLMGMPITVEAIDKAVKMEDIEKVFDYFEYVDNKFSLYKNTSEISKINKGIIKPDKYSKEMKEVFKLAEKTRLETNGFFNIIKDDKYDTNGLVKGWAIYNAANILKQSGFLNYYVDAGGDIQAIGQNESGESWRIGIRNPFKIEEIVKVIAVKDKGVATSGTYIRGQHVYNPIDNKEITDIVSLTVIGPNVYEADRFATAAFAMDKKGIEFIENMDDFEGYSIDKDGIATMTSNFERYVV